MLPSGGRMQPREHWTTGPFSSDLQVAVATYLLLFRNRILAQIRSRGRWLGHALSCIYGSAVPKSHSYVLPDSSAYKQARVRQRPTIPATKETTLLSCHARALPESEGAAQPKRAFG